VRAVADLYALRASAAELSVVARQGSGSACRSLMGGYVAWNAGARADGADSRAELVADAAHWPRMRALILVASGARKAVPSTSGMQATAATSQLFKARVEEVVPRAMAEMKAAIRDRDFEKFAEVTMRDSNGFHAVCLDTTPPIFYLNDASRAAIRAVEAVNARAGRAVAAYTFDAGPNAVVYYLQENEAAVAGVFRGILPQAEGWEGNAPAIEAVGAEFVDEAVRETLKEGVRTVLLTGVGDGPRKVERHLVDEKGNVVDA
jgi:diphosphomevalonate decarboxylase